MLRKSCSSHFFNGKMNGYAPEYARQSFSKRCISFDSYIKPQRIGQECSLVVVVYLLIPTSNHNRVHGWDLFTSLYVF